MENNNTEISNPCLACLSHDGLKEKIDKSIKDNAEEHMEILQRIDETAVNMKWMNIIGRWILVSLLGYFIALGYYIVSHDYLTTKDKTELLDEIKEGEKLHYRNENNIASIKSKLEAMHQSIKDK